MGKTANMLRAPDASRTRRLADLAAHLAAAIDFIGAAPFVVAELVPEVADGTPILTVNPNGSINRIAARSVDDVERFLTAADRKRSRVLPPALIGASWRRSEHKSPRVVWS